MHGTGDAFHEAEVATAEDYRVPFAGYPCAEGLGLFKILRSDGAVGGAEDSYFHWCGF